MTLQHSPSIVTNGLVFAYDMPNIKSYKGPAIQNISNTLSTINAGIGTGFYSTPSSEVVNIPQIGQMTVNYNLIQNNYTSYSPNSGNCCPSLFNYGSITVTPNTTYTYGILYRCNSGYTHPNFMYRYEYNTGVYVKEAGIFDTNSKIHLGEGWYYQLSTFTTSATTNSIQTYLFYYNYSPYVDKVSVAKVLITPGTYTSLHPKYWPDTNTTRANTQNVLDLTNTYNITSTSLTYNTDGSFSFDGSSNYIDTNSYFNSVITGTNSFSLEFWVNPNSTQTTYADIFGNHGGATVGVVIQQDASINNQFYFAFGNGSAYSISTRFNLTASVYNHLVIAKNATYTSVYINGTRVVYDNFTSSISPNTNYTVKIGLGFDGGVRYFNGYIPVTKIYNRELTAQEVLQNFNALRGRYGV